jgi:hypothetical protein
LPLITSAFCFIQALLVAKITAPPTSSPNAGTTGPVRVRSAIARAAS